LKRDGSNPLILVVDDDRSVRKLLHRCLEGDGYIVLEAETERDVISALEQNDIRLITLDLNLGHESGVTIAQSIRRRSDVPIIMLTGKGDVIDRVVGLEVGADDYITKPFHVREVLARVKTVLRRTDARAQPSAGASDNQVSRNTESTSFRFDGLVANTERFELLDRDGNVAELTTGDFNLLQIFLKHPKRVLSREHIMDQLNGIEWTPLDRTIDNQVARLRKKLEREPANPMLIKTVRGIGYIFATDVERG
jgi:DNA-binding response OmpR family regulator